MGNDASRALWAADSKGNIVLACNSRASEFFGMIRLTPDRLLRSRAIAVVAGIGAALILAIGLLLTPAVQRALLQKALVSSGAGHVAIGRFRAGPTGLSLGHVQFAGNGFHVDAGSLSVRIIPSRLMKGRVAVAGCVGRDLDCSYDIAAPAAPGGAAAEAAVASAERTPQKIFSGLLKSFHLPASVEGVDLRGRLTVLRGAETVAVCAWQMTGGGFAPGSAGTLKYSVETSSPATAAAGFWRGAGTIRMSADREGAIERLDIRGELAGPGGSKPPVCTYDLSALGAPEGEDYRAVIDFAGEGGLEFNGGFRPKTSLLTGRIVLGMAPAAVARASNSKAEATIDLSADFATRRMQAKAVADVLAADLDRVLPQLAAMGLVRCHAEAVAQGDGSTWKLASGSATMGFADPSASVTLKLLGPAAFWPWKRPVETVAELRLEHLPLAWANPWLKAQGLSAGPGELNAAWRIGFAPGAVQLAPVGPLTLEPIRLSGGALPPLPPMHFRASPRLGFTAAGMSLVADDLRLETDKGDSVAAKLAADYSWQGGVAQFKAGFDGAFPTLLSGPEHPLPFLFTGRCAASRSGKEVTLSSLEFALRPAPRATPYVALSLAHPFSFETGRLSAIAGALGTTDLAKLSVKGLPLAWLSRWMPGRSLDGAWSEGESVLRHEKGLGLVIRTTTPWHAKDLRLAVGGREIFRGEFSLSPGAAYGPGVGWFHLEDMAGRDANGNRLRGALGFDMHGSGDRPTGDVSFVMDLPALPNSGGTFGPLHASFSATGSIQSAIRATLDRFAFNLVDAGGAILASAQSQAPVLVERAPQAGWLASSPRPLRFSVGRIPLSWCDPYLAANGFAVEGMLQPTAMDLRLSPGHFRLVSVDPLAVADFELTRRGRTLVDRGLLNFRTAFDLGLSYELLPVFHADYTAGMSLTYGIAYAGGDMLDRFETAFEIVGNEKSAQLRKASGAMWADLGAIGRLPLLAHARFPAKGVMNLEMSNDPVKTQVVEIRGRLSSLVGRDGRPAPNLDWVARARADPAERVGGFRVQATLDSKPRPSDATFLLKVDRKNLELLDFSSKFESKYLDLDAARAFAGAFSPARPGRPRPVAPKAPGSKAAGLAKTPVPTGGALPMSSAAPSTSADAGPIWGGLRGKFILDIGTVAFAPYTIDHLAGEWNVTDRSFALRKLSGKMLDGDWDADMAVDYALAVPAGPYLMAAHFDVHRFDAQRAVALAFPNEPAKVDGRLNLSLSLSSSAERIEELMGHATGDFSMSATNGAVRLTLPKADMASSLLILGGAVTFSPQLQALGRLVRQMSNLPFDRCEASGRLAVDGGLNLEQFHLDSPQLRFSATGRIANARTRALLRQPIAVHASLAASRDLGVILDGMKLLDPAGTDGFRPLTQQFAIGGAVGQPDLHPIYDFLARAVSGSHGTWGILMRELQGEIAKRSHKASGPQN